MTTHYQTTQQGGMSFTSTRRPGEVRIPNYVYDIWMPLLGIEAIGVYAVYCRLEREGTVKAMSQQRIAQEMRIGVGKLNKTNDLLKRYGFIGIRQPEGHEKLMHYTTEITVHDPPRTASAATIRELKHPKGYETLCPWLTETEPQPIGNAGDTNESCANQSGGNANVAPPVFAPSVVAEEPALPDSLPADESDFLTDIQMPPAPPVGVIVVDETVIHYAEKSGDPPEDAIIWSEPSQHKTTAEEFNGRHAHTFDGLVREVEGKREEAAHPDMTVATKDGDPWADVVVREWCGIAKKDYGQMPIPARLKLVGIFRKVGAIAKSGAVPVAAAIQRFPKEHEWWAEKVGFEWPSESFCNKLGMMLVPDIQPEPPPKFDLVEPDWLGVTL